MRALVALMGVLGFVGKHPSTSTAEIWTPKGTHYYSWCYPDRTAFSSTWNITAMCAHSFVPRDNSWIPGSFAYKSRINMGDGAFVNCEVIEFDDNRPDGTWWLLAECA